MNNIGSGSSVQAGVGSCECVRLYETRHGS